MRIATIALASILAASTGCATIMAGGPDRIPIQTNPPGATVYVNGQPVGQTPIVISLDRNQEIGDINIVAQGFQPVRLQRYKELNGWFWANICFGFWPMIVDLVTGDIKRFDDTPIAIGLTPGDSGNYAPPPGPQGYPPGPQGGYPPAQPNGPQGNYPPPGQGGLGGLGGQMQPQPPMQPQPQPNGRY